MERIEISKELIQGSRIICLDSYKSEYLVVLDVIPNPTDEDRCEVIIKRYNYKPVLSELQTLIIDYYNALCDLEIEQGLTFQDKKVWLTSENQFNYKAAADFAFQNVMTGGEYIPVTVKLGENFSPTYLTFDTYQELQVFILACFSHIQQTLDKYWQLKDSIDWSKYDLSV